MATTTYGYEYYYLKRWLDHGELYYGTLDSILEPIIARFRAKREREEAEQLRAERARLLEDRWGRGCAVGGSSHDKVG